VAAVGGRRVRDECYLAGGATKQQAERSAATKRQERDRDTSGHVAPPARACHAQVRRRDSGEIAERDRGVTRPCPERVRGARPWPGGETAYGEGAGWLRRPVQLRG